MPLFNEAETRDRLLNLPMEENQLRNPSQITRGTDKYFSKSRAVAEHFQRTRNTLVGSSNVIFLRQPSVFAPAMMTSWLNQACKMTGQKAEIDLLYHEGDKVGAGDPMAILRGSFPGTVEFETHLLSKIGRPGVAAYNAFNMASTMPNTAFLDMCARHTSGMQETELMGYAATVGSMAAQQRANAKGFIGASTDLSAKYYGHEEGKGTMPHTLIGLFADTVATAEAFHEVYPNEPMTVLCDFEGMEVTQSIALGRRFPQLLDEGKLSVRIDTHGARYLEGLDPTKSYEVLNDIIPDVIRDELTDREREILLGKGVSAAAYYHLRSELNKAGMQKMGIVPSSGFSPDKCKVMLKAGLDTEGLIVGTGSFIPEITKQANATCDTVKYNDDERIKLGREYLIEEAKKRDPVITLGLG